MRERVRRERETTSIYRRRGGRKLGAGRQNLGREGWPPDLRERGPGAGSSGERADHRILGTEDRPPDLGEGGSAMDLEGGPAVDLEE
jgi:hypothetical protein